MPRFHRGGRLDRLQRRLDGSKIVPITASSLGATLNSAVAGTWMGCSFEIERANCTAIAKGTLEHELVYFYRRIGFVTCDGDRHLPLAEDPRTNTTRPPLQESARVGRAGSGADSGTKTSAAHADVDSRKPPRNVPILHRALERGLVVKAKAFRFNADQEAHSLPLGTAYRPKREDSQRVLAFISLDRG